MALIEPEDIKELLPFMDDAVEEIEVPPLERTFPECIVVQNLPIVDEAKKPKLNGVLQKIFTQIGPVRKMDMPMGADGSSLGFVFIEYESKEHASIAVDRVVRLSTSYAVNLVFI